MSTQEGFLGNPAIVQKSGTYKRGLSTGSEYYEITHANYRITEQPDGEVVDGSLKFTVESNGTIRRVESTPPAGFTRAVDWIGTGVPETLQQTDPMRPMFGSLYELLSGNVVVSTAQAKVTTTRTSDNTQSVVNYNDLSLNSMLAWRFEFGLPAGAVLTKVEWEVVFDGPVVVQSSSSPQTGEPVILGRMGTFSFLEQNSQVTTDASGFSIFRGEAVETAFTQTLVGDGIEFGRPLTRLSGTEEIFAYIELKISNGTRPTYQPRVTVTYVEAPDPEQPPNTPPEEPEPSNTHFVPSSQILLPGYARTTADAEDYYLRAGVDDSWFLVAHEGVSGVAQSPRYLRVARIKRTNKTIAITSEVTIPVRHELDHFDSVRVHGVSTTASGWLVMVLECRIVARNFSDPSYALYAFTFRPDGSFASSTRMHQGNDFTVVESDGTSRSGYQNNVGANSLCGINSTELIFAMDMLGPFTPLLWTVCAMRLTVGPDGVVAFTSFTRIWTGRPDNGDFRERNFINPANNARHSDNVALFWCWPFGSEAVNRAVLLSVGLDQARQIDIGQTDTFVTDIRTEPLTFMGKVNEGRYGIAGEIFTHPTSTKPDGTPYTDGVAYAELLYTPEDGFHGSVASDGQPNYDVIFAIDSSYQTEEYAERVSIYDAEVQPSDGMGESLVFVCAASDFTATALHEFNWKLGANEAGLFGEIDTLQLQWQQGFERFEPYDEEWGLAFYPSSTYFGASGNPIAVLIHRHPPGVNPPILMPCDGKVTIELLGNSSASVAQDMYGSFGFAMVEPIEKILLTRLDTDNLGLTNPELFADDGTITYHKSELGTFKKGQELVFQYRTWQSEGASTVSTTNLSAEARFATYDAQVGSTPVVIEWIEDYRIQGQPRPTLPNLFVRLTFSCDVPMRSGPDGARVHFDPRG